MKPFRNFSSLRIFDAVAQRLSISRAAEELFLTKGAVSHQIKNLEHELGFNLFKRHGRGLRLTRRGKSLWHCSQTHLQAIELEIDRLQNDDSEHLHVAMATYFASRWLSPRLMTFMREYPNVRITLEPAATNTDFEREGIDISIRWGQGNWSNSINRLLVDSLAVPVANGELSAQAKRIGLDNYLQQAVLLHDDEHSQAWRSWFQNAGLSYAENEANLVIRDPNVRVEAVKNGQGVALYDDLISPELAEGSLYVLGEKALQGYGYHLCQHKRAKTNQAAQQFCDWIIDQFDR